MGRMTRTVNGSVASFKSPGAVPIRSLKAYFTPIQNGSGDPSPSNIRPISGHNGITVYKGEENLFPADEYTRIQHGITFTYRSNGDIHIEGVSTGNAFLNVPTSMYFTITPGTYTLSGNVPNSNVNIYVVVSNDNGGDIKFSLVNGGALSISKEISFTDTQTRVQISVSSGKTVNTTVHPCLKRGSEASKIESIPIEFPNGTTVYGGYIDLITGELVATHNMITYNTSNMDNNENYPGWKNQIDILLSYFPSGIASRTNTTLNVGNRLGYNTKTYGTLFLPVEDYELNQTEWIAKAQNIQIILPYITPRTITTLTPQQLESLIGQNNIWCNADSVGVTYDFAEPTDIAKRKHLFFNEPHDEAVIGNFASFETDMIGKLKYATFGFEPIQNGSGDPSPTNVRPIAGFNGINIYRSRKNMLDPSTYNNVSPYTTRGITFVHDGAGIVVANGTCNSSSGAQIGFQWIQPFTCDCYVSSGLPVSSGTADVYVWDLTTSARVKQWDGETASLSSASNRPIIQVQLPAGHEIRITCRVFPEKTADNLYFAPMLLQKECTDTTFEQYNGQTYQIEFPASGKNLFDEKYEGIISTLTYHSLYVGNEDVTASSNMPLSQEGYSNLFILPGIVTTGANTSVNNFNNGTTRTVTPINGYVTIAYRNGYNVNPQEYHTQIERGSTATAYEPYTTTIYGGYVDPIKGEIVAEWVKLPLKNRGWYNFSNFRIFGLNISKDKTTSILCDSTPIIVNSNPSADDTIGVYTNGADYAGNIYYYKNAGFTTDEEFNTYINSLPYDPYIVFKTQTPIHYPIDQVNLKTFNGINNFWSSGNGETGIVYWTHK